MWMRSAPRRIATHRTASSSWSAGQPGAVYHVGGDLRPFIIGQPPVFGGGAHHAVPYRPGESALAQDGDRLLQQAR